MTLPYKILIIALIIAASYTAGRYSVPAQTKDQSVEVAKNTHTTTTTVKQPDGSVKIVTVTDTAKTVLSDTKTTITPAVSKINVSGLVGYDYSYTSKPVYGISVSKEVIGPVTAGIFGLTSGIIGVSVGINF